MFTTVSCTTPLPILRAFALTDPLTIPFAPLLERGYYCPSPEGNRHTVNTKTASDTIAAIATAAGEGGISIVRVSGPQAMTIADRIFRCPPPPPSHRPAGTFVYGRVTSDGRDLDEALLLIMRAPRSYTREDMIEIQGHGGRVAARRALRSVLDAGARLAEPGEFTRRAFLNGRLDLLQAEAVLDLVRAKSDRAAAAALEQLQGGLSTKFDNLYSQLLQAAADIEATLDFPEEDSPGAFPVDMPARLAAARDAVLSLVHMWDEGHVLRDGALTVISGLPNVGKSTLLNSLLGTDRAIVFHAPGTTRDLIEEEFVLGGIPVRLVDTAGLRDSACEVERRGVAKARERISRADLHLYVLDASKELCREDAANLSALPRERTVVVLNKIDLGQRTTPRDVPSLTAIETCLLDGRGVGDVREAILGKLEAIMDLAAPPHAVISERHRRLLLDVQRELDEAIGLFQQGEGSGLVLIAAHLRTALETLGRVTGKVYDDELLDSIFSRFCIGK